MLVGLDQLFNGQLSAVRKRLRNEPFGVLTHAAAVDRKGRQTLEVLEELGAMPKVVFSPEHGLYGTAQAEEPVFEGPGEGDGAPRVVSLYGKDKDSLSPSQEDLHGLATLLIDLGDVGARYYTYVWSALLAARAAQAAGVHTLVLDRPNPISGDPSLCEGTPQHPDYLSFVGLEPLPIRHGLTLGEIIAYFFERDGLPLGSDGALTVASTRGWERYRNADAHSRPFIPPSPNMPTLDTALVYPGACLVEGTNLSEGRGTTTPFQLVGAPFLDGVALARELAALGTPGCLVRPVRFRPMFGKHQNGVCQGVMIHVTGGQLFRPVATYISLICLAQRQAPEAFEFLTRVYEFESDKPAFDLLTGSARAREAILAGAHVEEVVGLVAPAPHDWADTVASAEARLEQAAP
jgi:uncharacterized protein YbbC (DUF1343 family)